MQILTYIKTFTKNHKSTLKPLAFAGLLFGIGFLLASDASAVTSIEFRDEIEKGEKLLTGGYLKLAMLTAAIFSLTMGVVKHNPMMLFSGAGMMLGGNLLLNWISTTFTALI